MFNALNCFIALSLKMSEKARIQPTFDLLMDDDGKIVFELSLFTLILEKRLLGFLTLFLLHS